MTKSNCCEKVWFSVVPHLVAAIGLLIICAEEPGEGYYKCDSGDSVTRDKSYTSATRTTAP
jgi:hypothetical protein